MKTRYGMMMGMGMMCMPTLLCARFPRITP